jgi:hypothetical protein
LEAKSSNLMIALLIAGIVVGPFWIYGFLGPGGISNYVLPGHVVALGTGISSYLVLVTIFFCFISIQLLSQNPLNHQY